MVDLFSLTTQFLSLAMLGRFFPNGIVFPEMTLFAGLDFKTFSRHKFFAKKHPLIEFYFTTCYSLFLF